MAVAYGDTFFLVHMLSILSEEGKELVGTSSRPKYFVRGLVYKNKECACNQYGFMTRVFVSKWLPVRRIICEVTQKNERGLTVFSEDTSPTMPRHTSGTSLRSRALNLKSFLVTKNHNRKKMEENSETRCTFCSITKNQDT